MLHAGLSLQGGTYGTCYLPRRSEEDVVKSGDLCTICVTTLDPPRDPYHELFQSIEPAFMKDIMFQCSHDLNFS